MTIGDISRSPQTARRAPIPRFIDLPKQVAAGEKTTLHFQLADSKDVRALVFEAPGVWQQRGDAKALADGTYEFTFTPPESGMYYVSLNNSQFLILEAK